MSELRAKIFTRLAALPDDPATFVRFRRFLACKVMAPFILFEGLFARPEISPTSIIALLLVALAFHKKLWRFAMLGVLGFSLWECYQSWPYTLNHIALEAAVLFIIAVDPESLPGERRLSPSRKIQLLMLSVWFFSGLQKLAHGYFAGGETLALEMLSGESHLGRNLRLLYQTLGGGDLIQLHCCYAGEIPFPKALRVILPLMGVSTILIELGAPLTVFLPRWRKLAVFVLFMFQLQVGLFSGEIDFAFTAFAILFLFLPRVSRYIYPVLTLGYLGVSPWI